MVNRRKRETEEAPTPHRPATTPGERENQIISLAMNLVEKRMLDGSATSQEVTHFLKLGSTRERLEQERLAQENKLLQAKIESMASQKKIEELYEEAIRAMRTYGGLDPLPEEEPFDDQILF